MLSVKKVLAGQGAVDYYLGQTRRGLADYYLPEHTSELAHSPGGPALPSAPASAWWGGSADALELTGEVERAQFVPLFAKGAQPGGGYLGHRFRTQEQAAAARTEALAAAGDIADPYERWMARHEIRRGQGKASVAAWDCTFSPVKSVSLLWAAGDAQVQREVWAAHITAVDAGLDYLETHAGYVRAGRNGVRVLETDGLVVARMNEWTSRDGDMQLHTHCLVLNRARTAEDGKWRALDGRCLLAARTGAGALYNRVLEAELTRRLGVGWRDRPDGLREIDGVDDELIEAFSTRRRAITGRLAELVAAYEAKYGLPPAPAVVSAMAQDATLTTRARKREIGGAEALEHWERTARRRGRDLTNLPGRVLGRSTRPGGQASGIELVATLLERLAASGRATFSRHDLLRAALDVVPVGRASPAELHDAAQRLVDAVLSHPELVTIRPPDPIDTPPALRRNDGSSIYERPARDRWTLRSTVDQETWLLKVARERRHHTVEPETIATATEAHQLGEDQAQAVTELLGDDRRIGLLVGPAGAGKSRTLRAAVDAWERSGHSVLGLSVSQAAAEVLATEAEVRTENTAKWLYETGRGRWRLPEGALVLIDEASMVATADLVALVEQARRVDGKVLLVGDPAQLAAIHVGGAFDLLAARHGASELHEIRRFSEPWEADASRLLRRRDPAAIAAYAMRGRLHGDTSAAIETELFDAWRADALRTDVDGQRQSVLMIVATNDQAAAMGARARQALLAAGLIADTATVALRDNVASVGDQIVTRRNDRTLATTSGGWVVNGDVWTITRVHDNGAATARRHADNATVALPAAYLAAHTQLGYATTAHRAQGMTVHRCHALITTDATHEQLYVAATRGRHGNHLWVAVDSDRDLIRDDTDLPTPETVLAAVCTRRDPDRLSAHQAIDGARTEIGSLARLGAIYEDAARRATHHWLDDTLTTAGLTGIDRDPSWPSLLDRTRQLALAGHDLDEIVRTALTSRPLGDANSRAAVLRWRLGVLAQHGEPVRRRGPAAAIPSGDTPDHQVARHTAELMRQRWRELRHGLDTGPPPPWATTLGPPPATNDDRRSWLNATTAIAAYRERFELPDHADLLGERPSRIRPDAQAAFDHAQAQTDRYLARHLDDLTPEQLAELDARQHAIITRRPAFDPAELEMARRTHDEAVRSGEPTTGPRVAARVALLERQAIAHRRWRHAAEHAAALRRQIALAQARRPTRRAR